MDKKKQQDIKKRKAEILLKHEMNRVINEYENNPYCKIIGIFEGKEMDYFNSYFKETLEIGNDIYTNKITLQEYRDKEHILEWILKMVLNRSSNGDKIVLIKSQFGLQVELLDAINFFSKEITKNMDGYVGAGFYYINLSKRFYQIFYDEEYNVYEYLKELDK